MCFNASNVQQAAREFTLSRAFKSTKGLLLIAFQSKWLSVALFACLCCIAFSAQIVAGQMMEESTSVPPSRGIGSAFISRTSEIHAEPGSAGVNVSWKFINHWDFPMVIERFEENCGCLRGQMSKDAVGPGGEGSIQATFIPGPYRGKLRKSLHVRFVGHEKPVELIAEVSIPSTIKLSRHELVWPVNQKPFAQTIEVRAGTPTEFLITDLTGISKDQFLLDKETIVPGRHYRITVTPAEGVTKGTKCLQVRTNSADPRDRIMAIFLTTGAETSVLSESMDKQNSLHSLKP